MEPRRPPTACASRSRRPAPRRAPSSARSGQRFATIREGAVKYGTTLAIDDFITGFGEEFLSEAIPATDVDTLVFIIRLVDTRLNGILPPVIDMDLEYSADGFTWFGGGAGDILAGYNDLAE